jgi:Zn-dependent M28 family amino/carboxypeptidase
MRAPLQLAVAACVGATLVGGCASSAEEAVAPPTRAELAADLPRTITAKGLRSHLAALQRIADGADGTRAAGTPGYADSVAYVRRTLAAAGYEPDVISFPFVAYRERVERARQLEPRRRVLRVEAIDYSPSTPRGGLRGRLAFVEDGCSPGDFGGARGRIAVARRGTCFIAQKAQHAAGAGALALLVFNPEPGPLDATLGDPNASRIPVAAVEAAVARSLLAASGAVVALEIETEQRRTRSQNVVADTHRSGRVLVVGAHLDSVVAGPGINDNGTGVAALLELARAVRSRAPTLAVRFAFWGAEESGLVGSRAYVNGLDAAEVVGYLNFDMVGSRGGSAGVYKGPFAGRMLAYFTRHGIAAETVDLTGRSDHFPFEQVGIPTGGLFAGVDRCYHSACDRLGGVNMKLMTQLASAAAFSIASIAPIRPSP